MILFCYTETQRAGNQVSVHDVYYTLFNVHFTVTSTVAQYKWITYAIMIVILTTQCHCNYTFSSKGGAATRYRTLPRGGETGRTGKRGNIVIMDSLSEY